MPKAAQPADVAEVIYEAATMKSPRLRWLVGDDAKRMAEGRRRLSDEDFVAMARPMPDSEYLIQLQQRFGFDWS